MTDSFLYFGYGCALNQSMVEFRVNQPVEIVGKGELKHYALKFNRKNPDGTARGNLSPAADDFTLGVIYKINKNKFEQLGQTEPEYTLTPFDILTDKGTVSAYAFICNHFQDGILPDKKYVNNIVNYARFHGFPESYITKILSVFPKVAVAT
nr:gamma-glutamylcyclotransferase [uncultured Pedobacter sp.]